MNDKEIRNGLNYNKLCHQALKLLVKKRIECELYHKETKVDLAISREDLSKELKLSKDELFVVTSILKENNEIKKYNVEFLGYYAIQKGIYSYGENKYLNINKDRKRDNIKYYVQTLIPIVTSLIALASIMLNISQWKYKQGQEHKVTEIKCTKEQKQTELNYMLDQTKRTDSVLLDKKQTY